MLGLSTVEWLITAGAAVTAIGILVKVILPVATAIRDGFKETMVALHIFNGRQSYIDAVTGEKVDAVPPLGLALAEIRNEQARQGKDITEQGQTISDLTSVVQLVADQQVQINGVIVEQHALRNDVELLKAGTIEKAAMRIENAGLFDMIAKRDSDVIDAQDEP